MQSTSLPDGTPIHCIERVSVKYLWREMEGYWHLDWPVEPGDVVLDVGANIGLFGLMAWSKSGGTARIFSFEPIPSTWAALEANTRSVWDPQSSGYWRAVRLALGSEAGEAEFTSFPRRSGLSGRYPQLARAQAQKGLHLIVENAKMTPYLGWFRLTPAWYRRFWLQLINRCLMTGRPVRVKVATLSGVLRQFDLEQVDWLKVDVEGAELEVLEGLNPEDWHRVHRVVLEAESPELVAAARAKLHEMGFDQVLDVDNPVFPGFGTSLVFAWRTAK